MCSLRKNVSQLKETHNQDGDSTLHSVQLEASKLLRALALAYLARCRYAQLRNAHKEFLLLVGMSS
jgi:hypothetical protein